MVYLQSQKVEKSGISSMFSYRIRKKGNYQAPWFLLQAEEIGILQRKIKKAIYLSDNLSYNK